MKFILFCVTLDLSDNLTETPNVKNSNEENCKSVNDLRIVNVDEILSNIKSE